eukprot:227823-Amphidinium_carterae.2
MVAIAVVRTASETCEQMSFLNVSVRLLGSLVCHFVAFTFLGYQGSVKGVAVDCDPRFTKFASYMPEVAGIEIR